MEMFDRICDALHEEMEQIQQKLSDGKTRMSVQDLDEIDKIAHALKCIKTYDAMLGNSSGETRGREPDRYYQSSYYGRRY